MESNFSAEVNSITELPLVAENILKVSNRNLYKVNGLMGAGKTTLIKEFCRQLECVDEISSPTYSIVNEYLTVSGKKIYHFDFYRIETPNEALDAGFEEIIDSGELCFMEWSEKIESLLTKNCVEVDISLKGKTRLITVTND